jgi:hypothetical protein
MNGSYNPTDLYYANLVKFGTLFDNWDLDGNGSTTVPRETSTLKSHSISPTTSPSTRTSRSGGCSRARPAT